MDFLETPRIAAAWISSMNLAIQGVGGGGADAPLTLTGRGAHRLARFGFRFIAIEY
jgi:hypothetical protein